MVLMVTGGYVLPILEFIFMNISQLDQALLRNFIIMVRSHYNSSVYLTLLLVTFLFAAILLNPCSAATR